MRSVKHKIMKYYHLITRMRNGCHCLWTNRCQTIFPYIYIYIYIYICCIAMINYTNIHMHEYVKCSDAWKYRKTLTTFFSSGTKCLLTFFDLFDTRRERHNFYYGDCFYIALQSTPQLNSRPRVRISTLWPNKRAAHPVAHKLDSPRPASNLN